MITERTVKNAFVLILELPLSIDMLLMTCISIVLIVMGIQN